MSGLIEALKSSWLFKIGLLGVIVGGGLMIYAAMAGLPGRASLKTATGPVTEAIQTTRTSTRRGQGARVTGVDFTLTIAQAGGQPVKLTIPSNEITRDQVAALINRNVRAEYDGESEVYALSSEGRDVISYATSIEKRSSALQAWGERGKFFIGLAIPLLLIGWFLGARRAKKLAAA